MRLHSYLRWTHLFLFTLALSALDAQSPTLSGELRTWHRVSLTFNGPNSSETASDNPFADYALQVTFTSGDKTYVVPGFYAADGDAAQTSATTGNKWRVHFAPDATGRWNWSASFKKGKDVAINGGGSSAGFFDGATGSFTVNATDKQGRDHRGKGRLEYIGEHYLRYAGSKEWFVKAGADAPENTLAYEDFDAVPNVKGLRKSWAPHARDYDAGEAGPYTWKGGKGSELLGAIAYLSEKGVNAFSFLTFNVRGDDENVFPHLLKTSLSNYGGANAWTQDLYHDRFDVSRLEQWERVFSYADLKGMYLHFKTQETENDQLMDGGNVGRERKLYYRELIARFGHHLALNWNMGEENTQTDAQRRAMATYFAQTDPYDHLRVIHTYPGQQDAVYSKLTGNQSAYTGVSIQTSNNGGSQNFDSADKWVQRSDAAGKKWVVAVDEPGSASIGVDADPDDRKLVRSNVVWATFMAGGAGTEFYYGYQSGCGDLECQDHRSRDQKYTDAALALRFFQDHFQEYLPSVENNNGLTKSTDDYVLANPGTAYAIYRPNGGTTDINLPTGTWEVRWYNPRSGQLSGTSKISGGKLTAPSTDDWTALVTREEKTTPPPSDGQAILLEAECASYGSAWTVVQRSAASGGATLRASGTDRFIDSPPTDGRYLMRFSFTAAETGSYRIFVRTVASGPDDDSMWIRAGGGKWYKWNRINFPYTNTSTPTWSQAGEWTRGDFAVPVEFDLSAGLQTIEIARRESGIEIDEIAVGLSIEAPTGSGPDATNCTEKPQEPSSTTFFELECTSYGSAWSVVRGSSASSGQSLLASGTERFIDSPPADDRYLIRLPYTATQTGTYRIFVRTVTSGADDDSMWIRVGGGKWYKWNRINFPYNSPSSPLWSQAGEWFRGDFAVPLEFDLKAGPQTIEIARRESGIKIDKLAIGRLIEEPSGGGGSAVNCSGSKATDANSFGNSRPSSVEAATAVSVYPNPVGDRFNLQFSGRLTGVTVLDGAGRVVRRMDTDAEGSFAFYRDRLAAGLYTLSLEIDREVVYVRVAVQ